MHFLCPIWTMEGVKNVAKVSFDANKEHKLQEGGVKISADFKVDPKNELYASLPGEGTAKEFPFAEISIKHLNLQDGTNKAPLVKVADYKDKLQLDVKEEIEIKGIKISGRAGSKLPRHIELRLLANLDLANAEKNQTKLLLDLNQTIEEPLQEELSRTQDEGFNTTIEYAPELKEVKESILNFTFADGRLTHTFNPSADLVPGWYSWQQILHGPIGNLIYNALDGVNHEQAETFKTRYDHQYAVSSMKSEYDFKGMVIDGLDMTTVINLIKGLVTPATSAEDEQPTTPTETVKEANIYNGIVKAFTLLSSQGDGKFGIKLHGLLDEGIELLQYFGLSSIGTGEDAVPLTKSALLPFLKDKVNGFMSMLTSDGLLTLDGCTEDKAYPGGTFIQKLEFLFGGEKDTEGQVTFDFDFTNGINWELYWLAQDNEEKAPVFEDVVTQGIFTTTEKNKVTDKGVEDVSIRYKSTIKFNETSEAIATDPFTEMFAAKKAYDDGIAAAKKAVEDAKAAGANNDKAYETATENYHNSAEYKAYVKAQEDYAAAKQATTDLINQYKTIPGVSAGNASGYYGKSLGLKVSDIYSQNSTSNTSKPLYLWVKNGKKTDGSDENYKKITDFIAAATAAVDTYKTQLGDSYESWKKAWDMNGQNNLWTAYLAECEALFAQNNTKAAAETNDLTEYKAYKDAQANKKTTDAAITTAEKAVKALEDPYFVYFYLDLTPAKA